MSLVSHSNSFPHLESRFCLDIFNPFILLFLGCKDCRGKNVSPTRWHWARFRSSVITSIPFVILFVSGFSSKFNVISLKSATLIIAATENRSAKSAATTLEPVHLLSSPLRIHWRLPVSEIFLLRIQTGNSIRWKHLGICSKHWMNFCGNKLTPDSIGYHNCWNGIHLLESIFWLQDWTFLEEIYIYLNYIQTPLYFNTKDLLHRKLERYVLANVRIFETCLKKIEYMRK